MMSAQQFPQSQDARMKTYLVPEYSTKRLGNFAGEKRA